MSDKNRIVSVCFETDHDSGTVSLWRADPDIRITINSEWSDGRFVVQTATIYASMASVLRDELSHWLKRQSPAPSGPSAANGITPERLQALREVESMVWTFLGVTPKCVNPEHDNLVESLRNAVGKVYAVECAERGDSGPSTAADAVTREKT